MRLRHVRGCAMCRSVTTVEQLTPRARGRALQVALTANGMRALGVAMTVIDGFSAEFISGMAGEEGRSRRLGDVAATRRRVALGRRAGAALLLMLYAEENLDAWRCRSKPGLRQRPCGAPQAAHDRHGRHGTFRFHRWRQSAAYRLVRRTRAGHIADLEYGNLLTAGEFLLGYRNEYGRYTDRPLLDPAQPGAASLPVAEDDPARRDLGRNGSYLVMRELAQDVRGFWRFIAAQAVRRRRSAIALARGDGGAAYVGRRAGFRRAGSRSAVSVRTNSISRATSSPMTRTGTVCAVRSARISAAPIRAPATCRAAARVW